MQRCKVHVISKSIRRSTDYSISTIRPDLQGQCILRSQHHCHRSEPACATLYKQHVHIATLMVKTPAASMLTQPRVLMRKICARRSFESSIHCYKRTTARRDNSRPVLLLKCNIHKTSCILCDESQDDAHQIWGGVPKLRGRLAGKMHD